MLEIRVGNCLVELAVQIVENDYGAGRAFALAILAFTKVFIFCVLGVLDKVLGDPAQFFLVDEQFI